MDDMAQMLLWLALSALAAALWALQTIGGHEEGHIASVPDDPEVMVEVDQVSMRFRREKDMPRSLKERFVRTIGRWREREWFMALRDISFTVRRGEVVGIVGTNGSGKSTLLRIICGTYAPSAGEVRVRRERLTLLALGAGFDHELSGRENVYLNGAICGYSRAFLDAHYAQIVAFAGLEGFMEEKVRHYSSGMVSRLAFAIATAGEVSGVLILDEVLSVGDRFFREKSEKRIRELIQGGAAVLIVSHSTAALRRICKRAIWIEKGELRMDGPVDAVCSAYEKRK